MTSSMALLATLAGVVTVCDGWDGAQPKERTWEKRHVTDDDIVIFTRSTDATGLLEVRAECIVDASPDIVFRATLQPQTYRTSSKHVADFRIVESVGDSVWFIYQRLSFPLVSDRDYTLRYEAERDADAGRSSLSWTIANDKGPPPTDGVVRIETSRGSVDILALDGGRRAKVSCTIVADPGGLIPTWLVNIGNRMTVPDILRAIREESINETAAPAAIQR